MRIQQRKKRHETPSERTVEPNDKLGDIKPQLSDEVLGNSNTEAIAREANRKQARDGMKMRPTIQKMPMRGMAYMRAHHNIGQPRPGF